MHLEYEDLVKRQPGSLLDNFVLSQEQVDRLLKISEEDCPKMVEYFKQRMKEDPKWKQKE